MDWNTIHEFDQWLTLEINSWDSAITDPIWQFFSDIPVWIPMYVFIVGCLIWRLGWKKGLIITLAAVATFGFCDQFSNFIKDLVCRVRPLNDAYMLENGLNVLEGASRSFSFFSAHSANAFGLATSTLIGFRLDKRLKYKGYAAWMYFWASMVAISRVFVGKHYLGDVIAGALIGAAAGFVFASIAKHIITRYIK
ncbi:MAG: phosphatase PAP2 family protein [Bacteroidales bacterium]|nr:phosphatase PAP2 family protein [Bacteroidales bacterium]